MGTWTMRRYRFSKLCLALIAGLALGMALGTFARTGVPTPAAHTVAHGALGAR